MRNPPASSQTSPACVRDIDHKGLLLLLWLSCAILLLGFLLVQAGPSFGRDATGEPSAGRDIFLKSCQHCHGPAGRGDGELAQFLTPPPANLTSRVTQSRTDKELRKIILEGRQGTSMAGFEGAFGDRELIDIIAFIRSLKP